MHEAGIARSIVDAIRDHGLEGVPVRVLVTGGHDAPADFDASLRFHLAVAAPELNLDGIEIVHRPGPRWCPACGRPSVGLVDAACPGCGGPTMGTPSEEAIELEWGDAAGSPVAHAHPAAEAPAGAHSGGMPAGPSGGTSDPPDDDRGPSAAGDPAAHAGAMRPIVPADPAGPPADGDRRPPDAGAP